MIMLTCPNCGMVFPVLPMPSRGWCGCGLDYEIDEVCLTAAWKPDKQYPKSGDKRYVTNILTGEVLTPS